MAKKKKTDSYFDRLTFDPKLLGSYVAGYIGNIRIVFLLILSITLLGLVSYFNLPKRLNPEVEIPIVIISTILPGASPEDIESLVTIPLENELKSVKGLDTMQSSSQESASVITLQFASSVGRDEAKNRTQSIVDSVTELPDDATTPTVTALDFEDQPIWTFALTSKSNDTPSLMKFSEQLKNNIEDSPKVDRVVITGFEEQEIAVTIDPLRLQTYGFNPLQLSQALKKSIDSYPAGLVETGTNAFSVTINPSISSVADVRNLELNVQGTVVKLGELATVAERAKAKQTKSFFMKKNSEPVRAVTFYVYKTTTVSIDEAGKAVKAIVEPKIAANQDQFELETIVNTSVEIEEQFADLLHEFRSTIILVFICLFLFLGLRQAIISSLTVPLTFLSAFFVMNLIGMSINFLSLFAFLLALGLLVDDTIVVVSAMTSYYKLGKFTPMQTGLLVWRDTIVPIWSTTITTIWSFVPLLLASGIIGEFIKPIPIVVTVTMISSTAIAVLITLPIMIVLLQPQVAPRVLFLAKALGALVGLVFLLAFAKGNPLLGLIGLLYFVVIAVGLVTLPLITQRITSFINTLRWTPKILKLFRRILDHGVINIDGFSAAYYRTIMRIISSKSARYKTILAIVIYAVVSFSLLPLGLVKGEFFPKSDEETFFISATLPAGSNSTQVEAETMELLSKIKDIPEADFITAETGRALNGNGDRSGSANGLLVTIHIGPEDNRTRSSIEIAEDVRQQLKSHTNSTISVIEATGGPPVGADLQIKLLGDDLGTLDTLAEQVMTYLKTQPNVTNVEKSIKPGTSQLVFVPNTTELARQGVSIDTIGLWLRLYASGLTLDSANFDKTKSEKQDIVFKFGTDAPTMAGLSTITIPGSAGTSLPLLSLGTLESRANPTLITRESGKRTISVTATVTQGGVVSDLNVGLIKYADSLALPAGYSWATGGANEENQKSVTSILQAMGVAAVLILVTMVIQFGSFRQAFIVLIVIPLAVSSVFLVFALTGTPLSFPALIGVLSLFGIVVTNSMFIVDKININRHEGMPLKESIADAGASRMEPIILTKLSTVLGLLPITIADPLWRGLGGAIISGLLLASTIMLLFIPALYYEFFKNEE